MKEWPHDPRWRRHTSSSWLLPRYQALSPGTTMLEGIGDFTNHPHGYMSRRRTSKAKHSSATSFGRERDRLVRLLDPAQSMTHGVGMADKYLGGAPDGCVAVLPHPKRLEQHLALGVGEVIKADQGRCQPVSPLHRGH